MKLFPVIISIIMLIVMYGSEADPANEGDLDNYHIPPGFNDVDRDKTRSSEERVIVPGQKSPEEYKFPKWFSYPKSVKFPVKKDLNDSKKATKTSSPV